MFVPEDYRLKMGSIPDFLISKNDLIVLGSGLIGAFLLLGVLVFTHWLLAIDVTTFSIVNSFHYYFFDEFMILASTYGRGLFWVSVLIVLWIFGGKKSKKTAILMVVSFLILMAVGEPIKLIFQRPRPFEFLGNVRLLVPSSKEFSFPSGHALIVSAGAMVALLRLKKRYSIPLLVEAILVCYSRVYVGAHYPLDVISGFLLGAAIACFVTSKSNWIDPFYDRLLDLWSRSVEKVYGKISDFEDGLRINFVSFALTAFILSIVFLMDFIEDATIEGGGLPLVGSNLLVFVKNIPDMISASGYFGIFFLMILESLALPVPSEVVLPFTGYLVSLGKFDLVAVISVSVLASVSGAIGHYLIGFFLGEGLLKWHKHFGDRLKDAEKWFDKYGGWAVFICRFIPYVRTLIGFPAGMARLNILKYLGYTLAGCVIWNTVLIYAGFYLGGNWQKVAGVTKNSYIVMVLSIIIIAILWIWRKNIFK